MSRWDDASVTWGNFYWDSPDDVQVLPAKKKKYNTRTMASNPTPDNNDILRAVADLIADGLHTYEVSIGIKQNTEAAVRTAIAGLSTAELQIGMKKQAANDASLEVQAADEAAITMLTNCKLRLAQKLGQRWNAAWEPTGFPNQSTGIPSTQNERFTLLDSLKAYFTEVPANESADMGATAALCSAAWVTLSDKREALAAAETALADAFSVRGATANALRKRVRGFINELSDLIEPDDSRWEAFGLSIPANPSAPEPVASLTVTALGNGRIELDWSYSTRAIRFRAETFIVGVDTEWQSKGLFKDLATILKGFTAAQTVKVRIIASNDGGDAAPSPEVPVIVT